MVQNWRRIPDRILRSALEHSHLQETTIEHEDLVDILDIFLWRASSSASSARKQAIKEFSDISLIVRILTDIWQMAQEYFDCMTKLFPIHLVCKLTTDKRNIWTWTIDKTT